MDIDDVADIVDMDDNNDQQEAVDIDDIDNNQNTNSDNIFATGKYVVMDEPDDTVHKVRSYDLSITYDFFY